MGAVAGIYARPTGFILVLFLVFFIRRVDGSIDLNSSGTLVNPDGSTKSLNLSDFTIKPGKFWRSPVTGAEYPIQLEIELSDQNFKLTFTDKIPNQEINLSYTYWEGTVTVKGIYQDEEIHGVGFEKLIGYADSMEGEF